MQGTLTKGSRVDFLLSQPKTDDVVNELIILNYGLLNRQLAKFYLYNDPDALSYAYEALYKAIITFDPAKNHQFSTYATVCMYNRIGSYIRSLHNNAVELTYYEESVNADGSTLLDVIDNGVRADDETIMKDTVIEALIIVDDIILTLNSTQRRIAYAWRDSNFVLTHALIAEQVGCTQSYVSQVIKRLNKLIKNKLEEINHDT